MSYFQKVIATFCFLAIFLVACSNDNSESKSIGTKLAVQRDSRSIEKANEEIADVDMSQNMNRDTSSSPTSAIPSKQKRMVVYNANLQMEVKNLKETQTKIGNLASDLGGYIIEQDIYSHNDERDEGTLIARIPEKNFRTFINKVEDLSVKINERSVRGQDVTEEFVDLESRLKSKQLVEKRLISFMNEAKDTKNLLEISKELARVQEEIEALKGRLKFLENQTSLATISIHLYENKVVIPTLEKEQLNTWEKSKKQFMVSINFIMTFFSILIIFTIGNLPIILVMAILITLIWFIRKFKKNKSN